MENYYEILGVNENATQDEIKKSYRNLSKIHHPDKGGSEETFKKIQEAYDTLGRFFLNDKNYSKALPLFKKAKSIKKDIDNVDENIFKCEAYLANWKNYRANLENISNKIKVF